MAGAGASVFFVGLTAIFVDSARSSFVLFLSIGKIRTVECQSFRFMEK